jgi:hypothetical protein
MEKSKDESFEFWAVVELFGHQKIAGCLTEKPKGSVIFFQIDVPDANGQIRYSRIINASSIYAINPTDKETILRICAQEPFDTNRPAIPHVPRPEEPRVSASGLLWEQGPEEEY